MADQRAQAATLRREGWSLRRIAAALGVAPETARRWCLAGETPGETPAGIVGADGKRYHARRPTPAPAKARRRRRSESPRHADGSPATAAEQQREAFYTPPEVIAVVLPHLAALAGGRVAPGARCLEPAAGRGAILTALQSAGATTQQLAAVEIRAEAGPTLAPLAGELVIDDFLAVAQRWQAEGRQFDLVLTNPPFSAMRRFAEAALPLLAPGGQLALFGRLSFLAARKRLDFHRRHPSDAYVLTWRPTFVASRKQDRWDYAWFVWTAGATGPGRVYHLARPTGQPRPRRR